MCYCQQGYQTTKNRRTCEDLNECQDHSIHGCDQTCLNSEGSYSCSCSSGYTLQKDLKTCDQADGKPANLLVANSSTVLKLSMKGTDLDGIEPIHALGVMALDYDYRRERVCWINFAVDKNELMCANSTSFGGLHKLSVFFSVSHIQQFAMDWITGNIYFVDDVSDQIFISNAEGNKVVPILSDGLDQPQGIALDPTKGLIFFTDRGTSPKVKRANMDGSQYEDIVSVKIATPHGIAVDLVAQRIYWTDSSLQLVESAEYDGSDRTTVARGVDVQFGFGISVFRNYIYITNWLEKPTITKINKFDGSASVIRHNISSGAGAVKVYHEALQPMVEGHPCGDNNGDCTHICLISGKDGSGKLCRCQQGFRLENGTTCVENRDNSRFLIYGQSFPGSVHGIPMTDRSDEAESIIPVTNLESPRAVDYYAAEEYIYFADSNNYIIGRQRINGTDREELITERVSNCEGIAVDWISKNLYWTDDDLKTISVARLDGTHRATIISDNITHLRAIVVDPVDGYMYFSDWAEGVDNSDLAKIERADMDGSNRQTFVSGDMLWPNGLSLDKGEGMLYWCDAFYDVIKGVPLNGTGDRQSIVISDKILHPFGLDYYGRFIFWTDYTKGEVLRYDRDSEQLDPVVLRSGGVLFELRVYDPDRQTGTNACFDNNGGCSELCLPTPGGRRCECADGRKLDNDNLSCNDDPAYSKPDICDGEFECKNGRCVDKIWVCDGDNDCGDLSDEDHDLCGVVTCDVDEFACRNSKCITVRWLCDGDDDCSDGYRSDEAAEHCRDDQCNSAQFQCANSRCILNLWQCDGEDDCGDNSDELDCSQPTCRPFEFQCDNGRCVEMYFVCDRVDDCQDNTDERNCSHSCTNETRFECETSGFCINKQLKCNGFDDCMDGSDEANCTNVNAFKCGDGEFSCGTGYCLQNFYVCDGLDDCGNNKDEEDCDPGSKCKKESHFQCANSASDECLPIWWKCDGQADCPDQSDELDCSAEACPRGFWQCPNHTLCIPYANLCDGASQCVDGADEGGHCEERWCDTIDFLPDRACTHTCQNSPSGRLCTCPEGTLLLRNDYTCDDDSRMCSVRGRCSQNCTNGKGTYSCHCYEGYSMQGDGVTCKSNDPAVPYLIFSNRNQLRRINLETRDYNVLVYNLKNTIALDFCYNTSQVFWTDIVDDKIYCGWMDTNSHNAGLRNIQEVVSAGLATAEGLAVDWVAGNLYWVESQLDQIEVAKLNGSFRTTVVAGQMENPRAIALDPRYGLMFWTDWDAGNPRIERSTMAGLDRRVIFKVQDVQGGWPNGLTVDYLEDRVYWIDARSDSIHSILYDGSLPFTILQGHEFLYHPFAVTVFESTVYWTDWRTNAVYGANKWTGENVTLVQKTTTQPFDLHVFHPQRQPQVSPENNPCLLDNGGCSHLCLLNGHQASCLCPHLMMLRDDNKSCEEDNVFFVISVPTEIRGVHLSDGYHNVIPALTVPSVANASSVDHDVAEQRLYWTDLEHKSINRAYINGTEIETVIEGIPDAYSLTIDWLSRNMYWTSISAEKSSLNIARLDGSYRNEIHVRNLTSPRSVVVRPVNGTMYWINAGEIPTIERANMDGTNQVSVIATGLKDPVGLAVDDVGGRIYWTDAGDQNIQSSDLSGANIQIFLALDEDAEPSAITVTESWVFWAETTTVKYVNKTNTSTNNIQVLRKDVPGFKEMFLYDPNSKKATSNRCSQDQGGCSQLCIPLPNVQRVCACTAGYTLQDDNISCKGVESFLIFSMDTSIRGTSLDQSGEGDLLIPITGLLLSVAIDFDAANNFIYWVDTSSHEISRIHRDHTSREVLVSGGLGRVEGLAIDWIAGNMYWTDQQLDVIEVARVNGTYRHTLISENLDKPRSIVVHPVMGYLFWGDWGTEPKIERSRLDGSNRTTIIDLDIAWPNGLTIDYEESRLYWCEAKHDVIYSADFDGNNIVKVVDKVGIQDPFSITVFNEHIYWTDRTHLGGSIHRALKTNGSERFTLHENLGLLIKDVHVYSKQKQTGTSACAGDGNKCDQLCFSVENNQSTCSCTYGLLASDGHSCEEFDAYILFSQGSVLKSLNIDVELESSVQPNKPLANQEFIRNVIGLAVDYKTKMLYYTDIQQGSIHSMQLDGFNHKTIIENTGSAEGIAYDPVFQEIYWTSYTNSSISRISLTNKDAAEQVLVRLSGDDHPRGIAIDTCTGFLFWSNWNSEHPRISRSLLGGTEVVDIITEEIQMPNGIVIDHAAAKLFWCDAWLDKIERTDFEGNNRFVILPLEPVHPFGLAVLGEHIYWTDWVKRSVIRADKYTGGDVTVMVSKLRQQPMGLVMVSEDVSECTEWRCHTYNGGCDGTCDTDEKGHIVCSCDEGLHLFEKFRCLEAETNNCSRSDEFVCGNGECIPYEDTCDGLQQCEDGSDERESYCLIRDCRRGYFRCHNGRCVPNVHRCDFYNNCGDNSDENRCGRCYGNEFMCGSGECVDGKAKCDTKLDCKDYSDETDCPDITCAEWQVSLKWVSTPLIGCNSTSICIQPQLVCDGINDCGDNTDEEGCSTERPGDTGCLTNFHQCPNGHCIRQAWVCDRDDDCGDGSDETDCTYTCDGDQFKCDNNMCIPKKWTCDGDNDCSDNSDETNCGQYPQNDTTCSSDQFRCVANKRCIPRLWVCDGDNDCGDAADERLDQGCNVTRCDDNEFACLNGHCLQLAWVCDRDDDCGDGSDETDSCEYSTCPPDQYSCDNGQCIHRYWLCDGDADCRDNSDEANCSSVAPPIGDCDPDAPGTQFRCENNDCISSNLVCDNNADCVDESDERNCNVNECEITHPCHHMCEDLPTSFLCSCYDGYRLQNDSTTCEDINECVETLPCSQGCLNSPGTFRCFCVDGYETLPTNPHKCVLSATYEKPQILFANRYYIRSVDLYGNNYNLVQAQLTNAVALDFDVQDRKVYWSDVTQQDSTISRMDINGSNTEVLHLGVLNPDGLAVDWVGRNLYWCDKGLDQIGVSTLDGHFRRALIKEGLDEPRAIALDPRNGLVYWTDWGEKPYIGRASMDGARAQRLVEDHLKWPNGLTIDYTTDRVFWADAHMDRVEFVEWDGTNRQVVISQGIPHIFAISLFEDWLLWTDWENKTVVRADKYTGKNRTTLVTTVHRPMDIHVYHPLRQPPAMFNPCKYKNGGCSNLCLLNDRSGRTCACPTNFNLSPDEMTCVSNCTSSQFICNNDKCIPFWWRCDGQDDCGDNSDEPEDCRPFYCVVGQFQCANSTEENKDCINPSYVCDGENDCKDASDELSCERHTCMPSQWKCHNSSRCIPLSFRCDSFEHCPNGEDEQDCPTPTCREGQFSCLNVHCIPEVWKCDGDDDCGDGSDEPDTCEARTCPENHFTCNNSHCIPDRWLCDLENDCGDDSDEIDCGKLTCAADQFHCLNYRCVPLNWRCDADDDCQDGSDEDDCDFTCTTNQFTCDNNECIPQEWKCNGELNCADGSDENQAVCDSIQCTPDEFKCENNQCIWNRWHCDGDRDCNDGSDENGCMERTCMESEFPCNNTQCVPRQWRCDGEDDCGDNSDEDPGLCAKLSCSPNRFQCSNHICIYPSLVCDGHDNCGDNSDEDCAPVLCNADEFKCGNRHCISLAKVCDRFDDCGDRSDEADCIPRTNCTGDAANCTPPCDEGYALQNDGVTCYDIDECEEPGKCSQLCENLKGTYSCGCFEGYIQDRSGLHSFTCKAEGPPDFLLIPDNGQLQRLDPNLNSYTVEYRSADGAQVDALDFIYSTQTVFMVDSASGNISRATVAVDRSGGRQRRQAVQQTIVSGLTNPRGIAVDWVTSKIYWVDATRNTINVAQENGRNQLTLVGTQLRQPHAIVAHPSNSWIFWTEIGRRPLISRIDMDGVNRMVIVSNDLQYPTGLAIDYVHDKLYWADSKAARIEMADLNGDNQKVVIRFQTDSERPFAIDVFEDWIYGTTEPSKKIFKVNKFGRTDEEEESVRYLVEGLSSSSDIVLVQKQKQAKDILDPCQSDPCEINQLCLKSSSGYSCNCTEGYMMTNAECVTIPSTPSPCVDILCQNGGTCTVLDDGSTKCRCQSQFNGDSCEVDRCERYCLNEGTCVVNDYNSRLTCTCTIRYKGERCSTDRCDAYCNSRGNCEERDGVLVCLCSRRYTGDKCETDLCEGYCLNGGTCRVPSLVGNATAAPSCTCPYLHTGDRCEVAPQRPCEKLLCANQGICHNISLYSAVCNCTSPRYTGPQCMVDGCDRCFAQGKDCHVAINGTECVASGLNPHSVHTTALPGVVNQNTANKSKVSLAVALPVILVILVVLIIVLLVRYKRKYTGSFKHHRMKQDPDNVEIGNPTFMYEPQLNEDDGPQLVDTAFTVKGIKRNFNIFTPSYRRLSDANIDIMLDSSI
ncbi:low-density lipoprotein receptor-related protein 1-like isoform X2 [Asterias rubens]|uniref:low-density lipoprotein receptor-related protein 1-like isoform X2 n=1 Tax=Asterias rubens TaxID=7604 RepID=UPI001455BDE0|nr:low-density lipoprotein receptor-related protein 1-like isoform X2 [Asterias rubens]